jgi:uncharacterized membrane protein YfcA
VIGSLKIPASAVPLCCLPIYEKSNDELKLLFIMMALAIPSAFIGSTLLTYMSNDFMKPLLLFILSLLAVYTYAKKKIRAARR